MPDKIVVNGIKYDSLDAMPPEARQAYERALQMIKDLGKGVPQRGSTERTVKTVPGGVSVNVHTSRVQYNIDGKTYDDPDTLPPEVRARVAQALEGGGPLEVRNLPPRDMNVMQVHTEVRRSPGVGRIVLWLLIGAALALLAVSLF